MQDVDIRPVLDLSSVPDDVTLLFEAEGDAEVSFLVTESADGSGDTSLMVDLQLPESLEADELEFEIETAESGAPQAAFPHSPGQHHAISSSTAPVIGQSVP